MASQDGNFNYDQQVVVETSQKTFRDVWTVCLGGVSNQAGPFIIPIEPQVDKYLQANRSSLETVVSIEREDGTQCGPLEDIVAPVDGLGSAIWDQIQVAINGHELNTEAAVHANYKANLETQLSHDQDSRACQLSTQFHHPDTPGEFENMSVDEGTMIKMVVQSIEQGRLAPPEYPVHMRLAGEAGYVETPGLVTEVERESDRVSRLGMRHVWVTDQVRQLLRANHAMNARSAYPGMKYNTGFSTRYRLASASARINLITPLCHDFFNMDNHIGPGNRLEITLTRAKDSFVLNTYLNQRYRLRIHDIKLHLHTITRRESFKPPSIERYRFNETHIKTHAIARMTSDYTFRLNYHSVMPKTVIFSMVYTRAFNGAYNLNPFNFQHFGLEYIALDLAGEEYPSGGLRFDFGQHPTPHMARGYRWIFENTGALVNGRGNLISYPGFETGQFILPFDLTPDKCNGLHNHQPVTGAIDVKLKFRAPLAEPVTVVCELVYNKILINDKEKGTVQVVDVQV